MNNISLINNDIFYVGASTRRETRFENIFPIENGVSFNSYLIVDEKTALLDTCDESVCSQFFENIEAALCGKELNYLIINHMEPDHCSQIINVINKYPDVKIVGNTKTFTMMEQFFDFGFENRIVVKEGDTLNLGKHTLKFIMAPMVHWPEAMISYDETSKTLFSADAFGTFGALDGNIFADNMDFQNDWVPEARRYYSNIVGKYGSSVNMLLKKASTLEIKTICPLHGPIFTKNLEKPIALYSQFANYKPTDKAVVIFYATMYGNTENAADLLANMMSRDGIKDIKLYDVSITDVSYLLSEVFRCSNLVFASPTYNADMHPKIAGLIEEIKSHAVQGRKISIIENGSWAPIAGNKMIEKFSTMKNMELVGDKVTIKSSVNKDSREKLKLLSKAIYNSMV